MVLDWIRLAGEGIVISYALCITVCIQETETVSVQMAIIEAFLEVSLE